MLVTPTAVGGAGPAPMPPIVTPRSWSNRANTEAASSGGSSAATRGRGEPGYSAGQAAKPSFTVRAESGPDCFWSIRRLSHGPYRLSS